MDLPILKKITHNFQLEMEQASQGEKTSFAWVVHTIPQSPIIKNGEIFQVIGIGGTVFHSALLQKKQNKLLLFSYQEGKVPIFHDKNIFFTFLLSLLDKKITTLALNFGFPSLPHVINGYLDGRLLQSTKEHAFTELIGELVGKGFTSFVKEKTNRSISVSLANDTICLLLSGLTKYPLQNLAAAIVGTGLNAAIFLDNKTLINLEAGGFDKFPLSRTGKKVDEHSLKKGLYLFEKEISGAYLYQHFNFLLSENNINHPPIASTKELHDVAMQNRTDKASVLAKSIFKRSATLSATILAGVANFQKKNLVFVMQGSPFWKGYLYKETVAATIQMLTPYTVTFIDIPHSDILGAAKLVA